MQNVAKYRLIEGLLVPRPVRTNSGKYAHFLYLDPIRTNESQRAINAKKVAVNDFVGSIWIQTNIFTPKVDQII